MSRFLLREIPYSNIHVELAEIGFDSLYLDVISEKFRYKNIKIYGLSTAQANILKRNDHVRFKSRNRRAKRRRH